MFNLKLNTTALASMLTASLFAAYVHAAPGTIATQPLQTSAGAESNIMFVLDSSGSMDIVSPEPLPTSFSYTCTDATAKIADGTTIDLRISGTGAASIPKIRVSGSNYDLGNTSTTRCFDSAYTYNVNLNAGLGDSSWNQVPNDGNYLNWYFDTTTDSGPDEWDTKDYKPGTRTRMEVAQAALNGLLDTLKSVNVGLATFDASSNGADLDVAIAPIDATHVTTLKTAVSGTSPGGGTPLAETLLDIGRYFANGDGTNGSTSGQCGGLANTDLTIHPDDALTTDTPAGLKEDVACTTLLNAQSNTFDNAQGPIEFFCQKNFAIMLTDGFSTGDNLIVSYLQDYDQDCPDPADPDTYTCGSNDTKSYDPGPGSDYWDDVAQALYEIDLRPDLNDKQGLPYKNNLATYTIGFSDKQIENLQLIKDAAKQGGGESYYAASSADLTKVLNDINSAIEGQSGTAAAVTFNSSTLSSQSAVYQALFNTQRWSGQLRSIPLDGFTGDVLTSCTEGDDNCWYAEKMLEAQTPASRTILTYNPVSDRGIDFVYTATSQDYTTITSSDSTSNIIPKTMIDDFCASHDIPYPCNTSTTADSTKVAANNVYMEDLVNYLRGDRTHEATTSARDFRIRGNKLGDIVNSSPVYVGKPSLSWPSISPFPTYDSLVDTVDNTYNTWTTQGTQTDSSLVKDRMPVVYVAANDGMLHGFRTEQTDPTLAPDGSKDAGEEILAFIPSTATGTTNNSGLHYLANPAYQHYFYVDLNPALSDVYIKHRDTTTGSVTSTEEWRTVLVGGKGAGGNTVFMLDVTDPERFSNTNARELVEWEFSQPNLGYTYSKPTIAMMNNGRFAAIFGNGYNSNEFGGDCKAKLFVVFLDGGVDGSWTAGTDYYEIDTTIGNTTDCNGLSTPAVIDLNGDKVADKAYAGDMYGNLWAFDLCNYDTGTSACQASGWGLANASPIMTTKDDGSPGIAQPITVKPVVSRDPASTGKDDLIIVFGTGQYLASGDIANSDVQTFYGVRNYSAITNGGSYGLDHRRPADKFVEQTITEQACTQAGCSGDVRVISDNNLNSTDNGWFIDFNFNDTSSNSVAGERIVVNPKIRNNTVFFNTVLPDDRKCFAGGSGWLMSVNLENGGRPLVPIFDLNNDGVFDVNDQEGGSNPAGQKVFAIPAESTFLGDNQYTPDSEGNISKRKVNIGKTPREGRMSWKELFEDN
ncbi:MAG: PilC/PilY family type IV pilus protein [Woeseiaceae bacterium]